MGIEHLTQPLANLQIYGVPSLQQNTGVFNLAYQQSFPTGTSYHLRNAKQSPDHEQYFQQPQSVAGFVLPRDRAAAVAGRLRLGPNLRFLRIAKNNKKISDIAFKDQVVATITQIANMYWDLVSAYEAERVTEQSYSFAQQSLSNAQKQLQLEAVPAMDVMRAEAEVSRRDQDLLIAKTTLQLQESLMKNAITKNLDDPVLESMPVIPTDRSEPADVQTDKALQDLITEALTGRPDLAESDIDLVNRQISRQAAKNASVAPVVAGRVLRRHGTGGRVESCFQRRKHINAAHQFLGRLRQRLQRHVSGLLRRIEPEYSHSQSRCQG